MLVLVLISAASPAAEDSGEALYQQHCAACHALADRQRSGPTLATMQQMHPAQLQFSLTRGKMREQARHLTRYELFQLLTYLSAPAANAAAGNGTAALCSSAAQRPAVLSEIRVGRWGLDADNSRYQPPTRTRINAGNVARLQPAWVFGLPGVTEGRSQPVITATSVFVLTTAGSVFALDRASGCIEWQYQSAVPLRTSLTLGRAGDVPALFFGDSGARVHALDTRTGEALWIRSVGLFETSTLTGAITIHDDTLIVPLSSFEVAAAANPEYECCRSHGAVLALDAASGEVRWTTPTTATATRRHISSHGVAQWGPSGAAVWSTPTVDAKRGQVYAGTGQNTSSPATDTSDAILALDLATGAVRWVYQGTAGDAFNMACGRRNGPNCPPENGPDFDFGAAVIIATTASGTDILLAGQKSGVVHAIDPDSGKRLWQQRLSDGSALGGVHWGMAVAGQRLFVPIADPDFPAPDYLPRPGVHALDVTTGAILWSHRAQRGCSLDAASASAGDGPWPACPFAYGYSAAVTAAEGVVFAPALNGRIHAFRATDGLLLWEYDTVREYQAVNGVSTHGGAIDNAGVALADDMLFVQSGYGMFGQMPGNALLAFRLAPVESP
ncbi:MAG: PQQ-binding-like beta-propeller repeat protein [Pseudomonadales bacterium]